MTVRYLMLCASFMAAASLGHARAAEPATPYVRVAEIEIDPACMHDFIAAANEEIRAAVRVEPGALALYAVSLKEDPSQVRILEIYQDADAYAAHLKTPHFLKFKRETETMVKSLKLHDTIPVTLAAKPGP